MDDQRASLRLQRIYTAMAPIYDPWTLLTESKSLREALESAAIRNGESALEVAVGSGILFRDIVRKNPAGRNVGIDLTQSMLERTRRKASKAGGSFELIRADARALPFPDDSFDVVINNNMLGLLPESMFMPILAELHRVLRPGGRLVIVMMRRPERAFARLLFESAVRLGGWRDVQVEPFVLAAGFEGVRLKTVTQLGVPSEVIASRKPATRPRND
jgi:ubiquinone/menaquinone biosynthesis C-methylase UbiE